MYDSLTSMRNLVSLAQSQMQMTFQVLILASWYLHRLYNTALWQVDILVVWTSTLNRRE